MSERVLPEGWREVTLGDHVKVLHGWPFRSSDYVPGAEGLPVVLAIGSFDYGGGFRQGGRLLNGYGGEFPREFELSPGDLMMVMTCQTEGGEILGVSGVIPDDGRRYLHNQRIGRLQFLDAEISPSYLFQVTRWPPFNAQLVVTATGSKILHTAPKYIEAVRLPMPPLAEQRAIAEVLGALDDKIAANAGVGRIARDCAAARFASCVSSLDAGDDTFEDFALIGGGGTPKTGTAEFWDGEVAWLTPTDVTAIDGSTITATARAITELGLKSCASPLYPVGTIFMTSRATIGAMAIAGRPMAVNQGFIALQPREGLRWWLFHEMKSRVEEFKSWANGATFLEISRGTFRKLPVRRADEAVVRRFEVEAQALHDIEAAADAENRALTATRDALLPALMSGRLTVRQAESLAEEAGL